MSISTRLYLPVLFALFCCGCSGKNYSLKYTDMQDAAHLRWEQDSTVLVFSGNASARTKTISLDKGKYTIRFEAIATAAEKILPHFIIQFGPYRLRDVSMEEGTKLYEYNFELPERVSADIVFTFDNDFANDSGDRNLFIRFPVVIEKY
jgi:uncharacterized protein YciI